VSFDELPTERSNPRTADIDRLDSLDVLERINDEDQHVAPAVRLALPAVARAVDLTLERWQRGGRVVFFGAGTSGRLAALDAAELVPTFGTPAERYLARLAGGPDAFFRAIEGAEDDSIAGAAAADDLSALDVAFGVAASGRTPWVLAALERARQRGAATIGLACVPRPWILEYVDVMIVVDTGPEPITGSTRMKAGTAQKLVLNAFSSTLMIRLGKVYGNLMVDVQATNAKLRHRAARLVQQAASAEPSAVERALAESNGEVKTAIAMLRLAISAESARDRLHAADGHLRDVLSERLKQPCCGDELSFPQVFEWSSLRGLLIDLDGVVYAGREPIPGGAGFLAEARRRGLKLLLVTNNSTTSPELVAERLRGMGIDVQPEEILTSAQAAAAYVSAHIGPGARVRIIGEAGLLRAAQEEGLSILEEEDEERVDCVLAGLDRAFSYAKLTCATRAILAGAQFVATNADALLPVEGGQVIPGAGSIVAAVQTATAVTPVVVGKPEPGLFEHGLRRLGGLRPEQVAMIGDRLDTDIVGGHRAGLRTILVLSGVTTAAHLVEAATNSQPDAIAPDLAAVAGVLGW
jgi:N-acetylmuramic acid 6-phosphate etherase